MLLTTPSFYGLVFTGITSLISIIMFVQYYSKIKVQSRVVAVSLIGILVGVHSLLHLGMEVVYNYNPIQDLLLANS
jgi:hypothetical protein